MKMTKSIVIRSLANATLALLLAGCASRPDPKLSTCDGKHRRPANLYGSVLPTPPPSEADKKSNALSLPPTPATPVGPLSSLDPLSFNACGEGL
jgi:hypothetical protein